MMKIQISASRREASSSTIPSTKISRTFISLLFAGWLVGSHAIVLAVARDIPDARECPDELLSSKYLTRAVIDSEMSLEILRRLDRGDKDGARNLVSEILQTAKIEIIQLVPKAKNKEEIDNANKALSHIDIFQAK